jgi:uncharacterized protein (TIGR02271 family)
MRARPADGQEATTDDAALVVPVIEEDVAIGVSVSEHERVLVTKKVETERIDVDATFAREEIEVERVRVDRQVDVAPPVRTEGDTTIIPVIEEEVVVQRRLVVREEIRITKKRHESTRPIAVERRRERVEVSRTSSVKGTGT